MGCIVSSDQVIQPYPQGPNQNPNLANRQAQFGQMQPMNGGMQQPQGAQPMYPQGYQMQYPQQQNYNYGIQKQLPPSAVSNQQAFAGQSTGYVWVVDKEFPPDFSSIAGNVWEICNDAEAEKEEKQFEKYDSSDYDWRRCADISYIVDMGGPELFSSSGIFPQDVAQGFLGDCYLLASMAAMAEYPHRVKKLFKSEQANSDGSYDVILYVDGYKSEINVQDLFLTSNDDKPTFCRTTNGSTWHMFVEKAFAKFYGSYAAIESGQAFKALRDLTGAPSFYHNSNAEDAFDLINEGNENCYIMVAGTKQDSTMKENFGLLPGHAYSLIGAAIVTDNDGQEWQIVQLRNPWGNTEWNGDWSDQSDLWTESEKQRLNVSDENDGLFWMSIEDFQQHYGHFDICHYRDDSVLCCSEPLYFEQDGEYKFISVKITNPGTYQFLLTQEFTRGKDPREGYKPQQSRLFVVKPKNGVDPKDGVEYICSVSSHSQGDRQITYADGEDLEAGNYLVLMDPLIDDNYVNQPPMYINTYGPGVVTLEDVTSQLNTNGWHIQDYLGMMFYNHSDFDEEFEEVESQIATVKRWKKKSVADGLSVYIIGNEDDNITVTQKINWYLVQGTILHPMNDESCPSTLEGNDMEITLPPHNFVTTVVRHAMYTGSGTQFRSEIIKK